MADYKPKGFLGRVIRRVRRDLREPEIGAEYSDDELLELYIQPAWKALYEDLTSFTSSPAVAKITISLATDQQFYTLPPNVHQVLFLGKIGDKGLYTADYRPRDRLNPIGPNWALNGTQLEINPYPSRATDMALLYVPSGDVELHEGPGSVPIGETHQWKLASAPTFGDRDRRDNAYAGCSIRIEDTDLARVYEYQVESYDPATLICVTRQAIDAVVVTEATEGSGTADYQIIPPFSAAYFEVLAMKISLMILAIRKEPADYALMQRQYKTQLKAMRNYATMIQARVAPHYARDRMGASGLDNLNMGMLLGG